jgi:hydroxyethylthiazole kinase-like uncharacterized protein yjeF
VTDKLPAPECRLFRADQVRQLDQLAITEQAIPGIELMQRAGQAAWDLLVETWQEARRIVIVCGAGNNAGDGYIVATLAAAQGRQVSVLALQSPDLLKGDAFIAARRYQDAGGTVQPFRTEALQEAEVIVDAIFGTGLDRELGGVYLQAIRAINQATKPVLAIDIPSGLNADTGKAMGAVVCADLTISFIGRKQGLYTGDAAACRGVLRYNDLGVPQHILERVTPSADLLDSAATLGLLRKRSRIAHKGHYGHLLVVGGDYGYAGAVRMCGEMAARSGAGLVSIATRPEHAYVIPNSRPELMATGVRLAAALSGLLERASAVAIGPGLGQTEWSAALLTRVLDSGLPLVLDADALNLLAEDPVRRENWILTPHPGEAARLLGISVAEVEADRFAAACALQASFGGVIVLKGSGTIIVDVSGRISVCAAGNPGMASGGMGDVLTGLIAGLLCQRLSAADAARIGVFAHATAADLLAASEGERGMLATDLIPVIRKRLNP